MMGFFSKEDKKQNQNEEEKGKTYLNQLVQMISQGQGFNEKDEKLV